MNFGDLFNSTKETVTDFIDSIKEKATDLFEENRKIAVTLVCMGFGILICLLLLIIVISTRPKNKNIKVIEDVVVTGTEAPLVPDGPKLPKDYNVSRSKKEQWSKDEAEEWFTTPSESEVNSLSFANERMVNEIIGAAP